MLGGRNGSEKHEGGASDVDGRPCQVSKTGERYFETR